MAAALVMSFSLMAQEQHENEHNLVPNPSFEEVDGKIKEAGMIELAIPWRSVTADPVDLYSASARESSMRVPENKYGKEPARTGENYAGVSFLGYRGRMPRHYLGVQLKKPLMEGKEYCMKMHVSMSDLTKYAVNNIAMLVTADSIVEPSSTILEYDAPVRSITKELHDQQYLWTDICRVYVAKGGEQHIVIGNFDKEENTLHDKVRLSRDFSGRQEMNAYYYVDDISVIPMDVLNEGDCSCDNIAGGTLKVESKSFGTDEEERKKAKKTYLVNSDGTRAEESIRENAQKEKEEAEAQGNEEVKMEAKTAPWSLESEVIYFDNKKFKPLPSEMDKLNKVANYMSENPSDQLVIEGHANESESEVSFIGKRRSFMIQKELVDLGIDESRISYVTKETESPAESGNSPKNQRVTFRLK
jgi:outer membrane protein OmpA-like peptidoglycan-associated protein